MDRVVVQTKTDMASENSFENFKVKYETIKSTLISKQNWRLKALTFSNPIFQKDLQNQLSFQIIRVQGCKVALPNFADSSKKGPILVEKEVLKLNLPKNHFNKKCAPKFLIFNEKKRF